MVDAGIYKHIFDFTQTLQIPVNFPWWEDKLKQNADIIGYSSCQGLNTV